MVAQWGGVPMSRVIAVVACGFCLAACSGMPSLNFLKRSSPPTEEVLRFESAPSGAEVKTSSGQSCRTPCDLKVQVNAELSATFTRKGYKPQTIEIAPEMEEGADAPRLAPNPVHANLEAAKVRKKPEVAAKPPAATATASAAPAQ